MTDENLLLLPNQHLQMLLDRNSDVLRGLRVDIKLVENRIALIKGEMKRRSDVKQMDLFD
jgi:hypothetical protein